MQERDRDERESREAACLARALEHGRPGIGAPRAALESALFLRLSGGETLAPERERAVLERVLRDVRRRRARRAISWALAVAALLAAGILPRPHAGATLPEPPRALLMAQASAAHGASDDLDARMHDYRADVLDAMSARYGAAK